MMKIMKILAPNNIKNKFSLERDCIFKISRLFETVSKSISKMIPKSRVPQKGCVPPKKPCAPKKPSAITEPPAPTKTVFQRGRKETSLRRTKEERGGGEGKKREGKNKTRPG
jgi:hypothetical protein